MLIPKLASEFARPQQESKFNLLLAGLLMLSRRFWLKWSARSGFARGACRVGSACFGVVPGWWVGVVGLGPSGLAGLAPLALAVWVRLGCRRLPGGLRLFRCRPGMMDTSRAHVRVAIFFCFFGAQKLGPKRT